FLNSGKFVTDRREKRKNGKFGPDVPGRPAGPVNLRITEPKTVFEKVACNSRDIALSPTPMIDIGLVDQDEPHADPEKRQSYRRFCHARRKRSASPLAQGERIEERGSRHGLTRKRTPHPTLSL